MTHRRFQRVPRGYVRSQHKSALRSVLDEEFYDPELESPQVGGGDPGIALLMASVLQGETPYSPLASGWAAAEPSARVERAAAPNARSRTARVLDHVRRFWERLLARRR